RGVAEPALAPLNGLNDHGQPLADPDANGRDSVAATTSFQLVRQAAEYAHSRRAERVADRDCAAVRIDLLGVEPLPLGQIGEALRRERLVQLHDRHVVPADARLL